MVEDKVGKKPYLGIEINYDKEKNLDKFSLDTLRDDISGEETHAQKLLLGLQYLLPPSKVLRIMKWLKTV